MSKPLGAPHRAILANGVTVLVVPLSHLRSATLDVFVRAGSRYETPRTNGLSHVLEHMLFRGTRAHPTAYEFHVALEALGGTLAAATHVDFTEYAVTVPQTSVDRALGLLGEVFASPTFDGLETEKRILREEILEDLGEQGEPLDVDNISRELLFEDHPLGFSITGPLSNVERFNLDDLRTHFEKHYSGKNVVLAVAGAVDPERVLARAELAFGALFPGERVAPEPARFAEGRLVTSGRPGSQTDVRLCFPAIGLHDARYPALQLLLRVLDDGMSARLHRSICDDRGLAYEAFAALDPYEDTGVCDFGASVEHSKTLELVQAFFDLVAELRASPVDRAELERMRQRWLWDLDLAVDSPGAVTAFYGYHELFDAHATLEASADRIARVRAQDLQALSEALFDPAAARLACVGLAEDVKPGSFEALMQK